VQAKIEKMTQITKNAEIDEISFFVA